MSPSRVERRKKQTGLQSIKIDRHCLNLLVHSSFSSFYGSESLLCEPVLRIHDILGWIRIRIRGYMPLTNGSGFDPAIFVIDLQDASKKLIFKKIFCLLLFEATFT
jgi:hypothetical protein